MKSFTPPSLDQMPDYVVLDERVSLPDGSELQPGVWYFDKKLAGKGDDANYVAAPPIWLSSPIHIDAITRDENDENHGRVLRFTSVTKQTKRWAMPMRLLAGDGIGVREVLLDNGASLGTSDSARKKLADYFQSKPPNVLIRSVSQIGWHGDSFVLPDEVIGRNADEVVFQHLGEPVTLFSQLGTIQEWSREVAGPCEGNVLAMLSICVALAGPLLEKVGGESGGANFNGPSSVGKSTLLAVAVSVWGGKALIRTWRVTSNGLEASASLSNDTSLALDELSEADPREIGQIVYMVANGSGKGRANKHGLSRTVAKWKTTLVSTGEVTVEQAMREGGKAAKAGQMVRLLDIPCRRAHGVYDTLGGFPSGAQLSDHLKQSTGLYHGTAGREFVRNIVRDDRNFIEYFEQIKSLEAFDAEQGQHKRAGNRFALFATAGELAIEYGIVPWQPGSVIAAASECFAEWKQSRGNGSHESKQAVENVIGFIHRHGASRFEFAEGEDKRTINNRAGWIDERNARTTYLFHSTGMHEAIGAIDFDLAIDALHRAGMLTKQRDEKFYKSIRVGNDGKPQRCYPVTLPETDESREGEL